MIKILVKAAILVCIILSIYFIVNPSACSNLINGRVVNSMDTVPTFAPKDKNRNELLTPAGDKALQEDSSATQEPASVTQPAAEPAEETGQQPVPVVTDTNSSLADKQAAQTAAQVASQTYTQADVDYAIASRYVELEKEYLDKKKDTKNAAKEISYIVMDDFELTPAEWEAFLQRATVDNLFEKVRQQQAAQ